MTTMDEISRDERKRLGYQVAQVNARARKAGAEASLRTEDWFECLAFFGGTCAYCMQVPMRGARCRLVLAQVVPASRGGPSTRQNVVPCCRRCRSAWIGKTPADVDFWGLFPEGAYARVTAWTGELAEEGPDNSPLVHYWLDFAALCGEFDDNKLSGNWRSVTCDDCLEMRG